PDQGRAGLIRHNAAIKVVQGIELAGIAGAAVAAGGGEKGQPENAIAAPAPELRPRRRIIPPNRGLIGRPAGRVLADMMAHRHLGTPLQADMMAERQLPTGRLAPPEPAGASIGRTRDVINRPARRLGRHLIGLVAAAGMALAPVADAFAASLIRD